jgi:hypothetical protein
MTRFPSLAVAATISLLLFAAIGGAAYAVAKDSPKAGPHEKVAFANVLEDGTLDPNLSSSNLPQSGVTHPATGVYCFADVGFTINSAIVSGDNSFSNNDTIVSVAIDNTGGPLSGCAAGSQARVRTLDADGVAGSNTASYAPALVDHRFIIWLRGSKLHDHDEDD